MRDSKRWNKSTLLKSGHLVWKVIGKDPDAGKDWRQKEKGMVEDKMVGWHHRLSEQELEQIWEIVKDRGVWHAIWLSDWITTIRHPFLGVLGQGGGDRQERSRLVMRAPRGCELCRNPRGHCLWSLGDALPPGLSGAQSKWEVLTKSLQGGRLPITPSHSVTAWASFPSLKI